MKQIPQVHENACVEKAVFVLLGIYICPVLKNVQLLTYPFAITVSATLDSALKFS